MTERDFDIVVQGATGFTGQLVAEYLLRQYGANGELRWALAGRSQEKLEQVRSALGAEAESLPIVIADSFDADALQHMAASTSVVLTTVGPYALYGDALVEACAAAGTHYCDLTGEVHWIRKMIDRYHEPAQRSGARIVHCCGFDSIPMDIGTWFLQNAAYAAHGRYCQRVSLFVKAAKGTASGGTAASLMNVMKEAREDRDVARVLAQPYSLNPEGERDGPDGRDQQSVRWRDDIGAWTAPFVMAGINTKVVRRSHALLGYPWGRDFRYDESVITGAGFSGRLKGMAASAGLGALVLGASLTPSRRFLERFVMPSPGEGPDAHTRRTGFFNLLQIGTLDDGTQIRIRITGDQDPGYGSTSKMLSESAVCLAKDKLESSGGVLTPASAMAEPLLGRLRENAGLTFDVVDQVSPA